MHTKSLTSFLAVATMFLIAGVATAQGPNERADVQIDAAARTQAITNLAKEVESNYPVAALGRTTANELRKRLRQNHFRETSAKALASKLTDELRSLTGDQHFLVDYFVVPRAFPPAAAVADPVSEADRALTLRLHNFGFERVERLAGNIGYLKLDRFETPAVAGETAAAAMRFLAGTEALIIDLTENGGGYSSMVSLLASYLFKEPVHLSDISGRGADDIRQNWTYAFVPGPRYVDKPVYILSGAKTFSAAEAFA
ncbi:MAG TPA: S41 family peptidase, partial [Gemmatimonadaceae bacterium]